MGAKLDLKKKFPKLYNPSAKSPVILAIPPMKFFMIDGKGNPNTAQEYKDAVETLYNVSYMLKMKVVKVKSNTRDYTVPPLEGLWYMDDMNKFKADNKEEWKWTMMIRIPDHVSDSEIAKGLELTKKLKDPPLFDKLRVEDYDEGTVVQILYFGAYSEEHDTIVSLHTYAKEHNYQLRGHHHEIYLSDPRRTKPERLKTVLRQPITLQK